MPLRDDDRAVLDGIAAERELNPALVAKVLELEGDFTNLDGYGEGPRLRRLLEELIVAAAGAAA